jgi:hypothetical protein
MKRREASLTKKASAAMEDAVRGVVTDHKRRQKPLAVWKDGKVVMIAPEQAMAGREEHGDYNVKTKGKS